jgi:hypothetical protein
MHFGMEWLCRLVKNEPSPTAIIRPQSGVSDTINYELKFFPAKPRREAPIVVIPDGKYAHSMRDAYRSLRRGAGSTMKLFPLTKTHPVQPHTTIILDKKFKLFHTPPGGLKKPSGKEEADEEVRKRVLAANQDRMQDMLRAAGGDADETIFCYMDASRHEGSDEEPPSCAGAFIIFRGFTPKPENIIHCDFAAAGTLACAYSGECNTMIAALLYILQNMDRIFQRCRKLVLVTDSQSLLLSINKTQMRNMGYREQGILSMISRICGRDVDVVLGFVFSHYW